MAIVSSWCETTKLASFACPFVSAQTVRLSPEIGGFTDSIFRKATLSKIFLKGKAFNLHGNLRRRILLCFRALEGR